MPPKHVGFRTDQLLQPRCRFPQVRFPGAKTGFGSSREGENYVHNKGYRTTHHKPSDPEQERLANLDAYRELDHENESRNRDQQLSQLYQRPGYVRARSPEYTSRVRVPRDWDDIQADIQADRYERKLAYLSRVPEDPAEIRARRLDYLSRVPLPVDLEEIPLPLDADARGHFAKRRRTDSTRSQ